MADVVSRKLVPLWLATYDDDHSAALLLGAVNSNMAMVGLGS